MEKDRLFSEAARTPRNEHLYAFVSGDETGRHSAPQRAAWEMEDAACALGWREGETIGSEGELRETLGVGREALREAIRIVESRGAMRMRRGRSGGLMVMRPDLDRTAAALATYQQLVGLTAGQLRRSVTALDRLMILRATGTDRPLPARGEGEALRLWLARASGEIMLLLYARALDFIAPDESAEHGALHDPAQTEATIRAAAARSDTAALIAIAATLPIHENIAARDPADPASGDSAGATVIAARIIAQCRAQPERPLGNEAELCESFAASRAIVRQALRILADLDMLSVKRGRGGGYLLKEPSPLGIIRHAFPLLAAQGSQHIETTQLMWSLNLANVRVAGGQLAEQTPDARAAACAELDALLARSEEPERFILLQQALSRIAASPLVDILARCIVSYQARALEMLPLHAPPPEFQALVLACERDMVDTLRRCDLGGAVQALNRLQTALLERILSMPA